LPSANVNEKAKELEAVRVGEGSAVGGRLGERRRYGYELPCSSIADPQVEVEARRANEDGAGAGEERRYGYRLPWSSSAKVEAEVEAGDAIERGVGGEEERRWYGYGLPCSSRPTGAPETWEGEGEDVVCI
jgi:hypothetical protein